MRQQQYKKTLLLLLLFTMASKLHAHQCGGVEHMSVGGGPSKENSDGSDVIL